MCVVCKRLCNALILSALSISVDSFLFVERRAFQIVLFNARMCDLLASCSRSHMMVNVTTGTSCSPRKLSCQKQLTGEEQLLRQSGCVGLTKPFIHSDKPRLLCTAMPFNLCIDRAMITTMLKRVPEICKHCPRSCTLLH